jgi:hypothetical protein
MQNDKRHAELSRQVAVVAFVILFPMVNLVWAERTYYYIEQVGQGYEHSTIVSAILAMRAKDPPLSEDRLGCIEVYQGAPGDYTEQLNDAQGGSDLPAHCDLVGMEPGIEIKHCGNGNDLSNIYDAGVDCEGDNLLCNLKINNYRTGSYYVQNSVRFQGYGILENCVVDCNHGPAVSGYEHLVVKGAGTNISSLFTTCITSYSTCEIRDCTLRPRTYTPVGENPTGIRMYDDGIIDNVKIVATNATGKEASTCLTGIDLSYRLYNPDAVAYICNTTINLKFTSYYYEPTQNFSVVGINVYDGSAVVEDCTIKIDGVEDDSDPRGDGGPIKVEGINIHSGAVVEIVGNTSISTSRKKGSNGESGYEYLLINGFWGVTGTLAVAFRTVTFDPNGDEPPNGYDEAYVFGPVNPISDVLGFKVKDSSDATIAGFDRFFGNLFLKGTLGGNPAHDPDKDEFRVQNQNGSDVAIIDLTSGNMYIIGSVFEKQLDTFIPSGSGNFIIKNSDGNVLGFIDSTGNVYLGWKLYENSIP